jgi:cytidylate kinase
MDGRDITTNVLPHTKHKFFVTASAEVRAERRRKDLLARGKTDTSFEQVLDEIKKRDRQDSTRAYMPLRQAEDAMVIDTSHLSVEDALEKILEAIRKKEAR